MAPVAARGHLNTQDGHDQGRRGDPQHRRPPGRTGQARPARRAAERGYAERTCRDYGHAVVHLGRYLHEELESDRVRDEGVVADFLAGHLPGCRCYCRPAGRREEPARRGLAHLLVMLREEGAFPPVTADEPPYRQLIEGYCRFLRHDRGLAETTMPATNATFATSWSAAALR